MKLSAYQSELKKIMMNRNGYLVIALSALGLCFLQVLLFFVMMQKIKINVTVPPLNQDVWVSSGGASPDYLSRLTLFLAELVLNTTSDNVDYQHEWVLRYADPTYYGTLKTTLLAEADRVKQQHISTAFFPVDIKVDNKHLDVVITGDLKSFVGEMALPIKRVSYHITYRFSSYNPLIQLFEEVKHE